MSEPTRTDDKFFMGGEEEDRISQLLDCLIVEILSRLPSTKEVIRTCTLSKRWEHLWTFVPTLNFHHNYYINNQPTSNFVSCVDKTLIQRPQLKLKTFKVSTTFEWQFRSNINNWIHYALSCNVEELSLTLLKPYLDMPFPLDQSIFTNSCFTDLSLESGMLNPTGAISWKNLKKLTISNGKLSEDLIKNILSGCPVLETLALNFCYGYRRLNITSKSVKNLVFSGYINPGDKDDNNPSIVEINAPYIMSLTISKLLILCKIFLLDVSSLVKANLNYNQALETSKNEAQEEILKGFILNLRHVDDLKIGTFVQKVLSRLEAKGFIFPSNMKYPGLIIPRFYRLW